MRKKISKYVYSQGTLGNKVFKAFLNFYNCIVYNRYTDVFVTKKRFKQHFGYPLNLNNPQTFNEKIEWLKLNDMDALKTLCSDKLRVRGFIKEKVGENYLIPLVYHTDNYEEVCNAILPDFPVIIKVNHASGKTFIIKDKNKCDFEEIRQSLKFQLRENFYHFLREKQYKDISPCIVIEKLLQDENGNVPKDYKIHCFNGRPVFIQVDTGRYVNHKRVIYDTDWNLIDIKWKEEKGEPEEKPLLFDEMIEFAKSLAKEFTYVRVDIYDVDEHLYFGELTFTPGAGRQKFDSYEIDKFFGDQLELPIS